MSLVQRNNKNIFKKGRSTQRFVFFKYTYSVLTYMLRMYIFPAGCFRQRTYMAQGLVNGVLELTLARSFNVNQLVMFFI